MPDWYNASVHNRLLEAAKTDDEFVHYSEIIKLAKLREKGFDGPGLSGALGWVLFAVVMRDLEEDASRAMLSAVALPTNGSRPGSGFFDLARKLGRLQSTRQYDEDAFWLTELKALREHWGAK